MNTFSLSQGFKWCPLTIKFGLTKAPSDVILIMHTHHIPKRVIGYIILNSYPYLGLISSVSFEFDMFQMVWSFDRLQMVPAHHIQRKS